MLVSIITMNLIISIQSSTKKAFTNIICSGPSSDVDIMLIDCGAEWLVTMLVQLGGGVECQQYNLSCLYTCRMYTWTLACLLSVCTEISSNTRPTQQPGPLQIKMLTLTPPSCVHSVCSLILHWLHELHSQSSQSTRIDQLQLAPDQTMRKCVAWHTLHYTHM